MFYMTPETESLIDRALTEDLSLGDATTQALVPPGSSGKAGFVAKEEGILAGLDLGLAVFKRVDPTLETSKILDDGAGLEAGVTFATVQGSVASILMGERQASADCLGVPVRPARRLSESGAKSGIRIRQFHGRKT